MIDLPSYRDRLKGWGDRMTIGIVVSEYRELLDEIEVLRERVRTQQAALESCEVQRDYWERMTRAAYTQQSKLELQVKDLLEARDGEPKDDGG